MILKFLFHLIIILFIGVFQAAFISALPGWSTGLQLVLIVLIFLLGLNKRYLSFGYAFFIGVLLDFISLTPFGLHTVSLVIANATSLLVLEKIITNRSLYSFLLLFFLANLSYKLVFFGMWIVGSWVVYKSSFINIDSSFLILEIKFLAFNMVTVYLTFYLLSFINKKFQPVFLGSTNKYGKI